MKAKQEHTEQIKIENTELRLRVNDLDTNLHDLQLKYDEMRQIERAKAKEDLDKLTKEKALELEVQLQQLKVILKTKSLYKHKKVSSLRPLRQTLVYFQKKKIFQKFLQKFFKNFFQIHANCRIRRVYFSDRLYSEDELPAEFKLYLPVQNKTPKAWGHPRSCLGRDRGRR